MPNGRQNKYNQPFALDILTHTLSGVAVATCVVTFVPRVKDRLGILLVGALGGAFPDLDAISLWSRFDGTIGKLFALPAKGSVIYSSKYWYSHHGFLHSLLGSVLIGLILMCFLYLIQRNKESFLSFLQSKKLYFLTFILAYWAHLAGDLPTPSSAWGGIALFWPSLDYVGGSGKIWWWNNYDIFLIIVLCVVLNLAVLAFSKYLKNRIKVVSTTIFTICLVFIIFQVNTRHFNYAYSNDSSRYAEMEQKSKEEQKRILGTPLYNMMVSFDSKLKIYF